MVEGGGITVFPEPISGVGDRIIAWISPLGTLFMRLIKMVIVPLVFASLLVGVASLGDIRKLGRLAGKTLALYMVTTGIAVSIGLICTHIIRPGTFIDNASRAKLQAQFMSAAGNKVEQAVSAPSLIDNILNIVPNNPMHSLSSESGEMLQIIFFAVILGIALTLIDKRHSEIVTRFFDGIQQAMVAVIHMVMMVAPIGVAALVAEVVGSSGASVLASLFVYGITVLVGLAIHTVLVYGGLIVLRAKLKVSTFIRAVRPAQLIAFSTSSSSAALPVTMECAEDGLGISNPVASFVLPLGSTVNMDGTALYQGVAALFIAQVFQMDLSLTAQLGIVLTATMASIGAAGVPGAGMVTLAMVLTQSGIPTVGVALILGMDRLLDMFRTAVNVTGDLAVASVMAVSEGETLGLDDRRTKVGV
ncbi:MAG: dicarboxylate/amino acid:cation symporter [Myxococcota bacterium]